MKKEIFQKAYWGHCIVFVGKTLDSHSASLHPGV